MNYKVYNTDTARWMTYRKDGNGHYDVVHEGLPTATRTLFYECHKDNSRFYAKDYGYEPIVKDYYYERPTSSSQRSTEYYGSYVKKVVFVKPKTLRVPRTCTRRCWFRKPCTCNNCLYL
jgi:hypothetical protein